MDADSFNNKIVLGDPLIVWSCGHSILYEAMPNAVRSIHHLRGAAGTVASMFDNRRKERILNHRWTLEGLSTGDPIYVMGTLHHVHERRSRLRASARRFRMRC